MQAVNRGAWLEFLLFIRSLPARSKGGLNKERPEKVCRAFIDAENDQLAEELSDECTHGVCVCLTPELRKTPNSGRISRVLKRC